MADARVAIRTDGSAPPNSFVKDRLPFIVATGSEFLGLYFWLYFFDRGGISIALAMIALGAGFLSERLAVLGWVKYFHTKLQAQYGLAADGSAGSDIKQKSTAGALLHLSFICLTEITIWVTFVLIFDRWGWVAGFATLMVGEQLQHSLDLALIARRPIREYIPSANALLITLLEGIGGISWLWLVRHGQPQVGGLILLIGLSIEHVVQGQRIKRDLAEEYVAAQQQQRPASV
jgi:hypothetical protein